MKIFLIVLLALQFASFAANDSTVNSVHVTGNVSAELHGIFNFAQKEKLHTLPINQVVTELGKYFIGTDYAAATLEQDGEECLVLNFDGLDCTTLAENVLALARCVKLNQLTRESFEKQLTLIRYRGGIIDEYPSRLHYFSDWIYDNDKKKIVADITNTFGSETIKFDLDFMSTHPQYYKHLKETPAFIPVIEKQEQEISKREYSYIPKDRIADMQDELLSGDLVAFTTTIKGLDISHVGIAVKKDDGKVHLLHASSTGKKVLISDETLDQYTAGIKKNSGILIMRVLEP